ncbi:hypothetical protein PMAYCL1PPCAC_10132, partial [Pristionchus mayeri]
IYFLTDPSSKKPTRDATGATTGSTGGASKKEARDAQRNSARLTAKADELLKYARTPTKNEKDDLTHRIMALSPSTTTMLTKERTGDKTEDDPDK